MDDSTLNDIGEVIAAQLPDDVMEVACEKDELIVRVRAASIVKVMNFLRDDQRCLFKMLIDITAVDLPSREDRFDVVYHLLSPTYNLRLRIKAACAEDGLVPSITDVYSAANWFERETWDMFGIRFSDNPDLRRLLTDYGFEGHPLRKDFPTTGFVEVRYDEAQKRVVYEPVQLTQEFRRFDYMSPWEGAKYVLPGDEKADGGEKS